MRIDFAALFIQDVLSIFREIMWQNLICGSCLKILRLRSYCQMNVVWEWKSICAFRICYFTHIKQNP